MKYMIHKAINGMERDLMYFLKYVWEFIKGGLERKQINYLLYTTKLLFVLSQIWNKSGISL